jgi:hypothetical protein
VIVLIIADAGAVKVLKIVILCLAEIFGSRRKGSGRVGGNKVVIGYAKFQGLAVIV